MILRSSSASPFARKVRIAADILGLSGLLDVVPTDTSDPDEPLRIQNPLGKIPTLLLANGQSLYDSVVILEYLDHLAGGGRIIPAESSRFEVLTRAALADGVAEAALLLVYEQRWRESVSHSSRWITHQNGKIVRGLASLNAGVKGSLKLDVSEIALAAALGYLDLRFKGAWREQHAALAEWLERFSNAVPAFEATRHVES